MVHADPNERDGFGTDHSGLNKFFGPGDPNYQKLKGAIGRLRVSSILAQADSLLRTEYYSDSRLRIHRLSGQYLPLNMCYINLAIVKHIGTSASRENQNRQLSQNSLFARGRAETLDETPHIMLSAIFDPYKVDGQQAFSPRRILIRGRAGVGKTTLCKKIVHDFTRSTETDLYRSWTKLFDRVLWIPLRELKNLIPKDYEDFFYKKYFVDLRENHTSNTFATKLAQEVHSTRGSRTLFILDGLDEVTIDLERHSEISEFLVRLLDNPNVIITSRPNASIPGTVTNIDLELETIGFSPHEVGKYIEALAAQNGDQQHAEEAQSFLQRNWLLRGLVQIPILLDAFCYICEDGKMSAPETMTSIYNQIELRLWRKDFARLKHGAGSALSIRSGEITHRFENEIRFTELLAFNGLYNEVIDFTPYQRDQIARTFTHNSLSDDTLAKLSSIRTSDPSSKLEERNYHFLHLTFQEYFAAKYIVRKWRSRCPLEFVFKQPSNTRASLLTQAEDFIRQHKYLERLDIFWRFVTGLLSLGNGLENAQDSKDADLDSFFAIVRSQPLDLLGQVHQTLLMKCLAEVPKKQSEGLRCLEELEEGLVEWVLFECMVTHHSTLAGKMEVSEHILLKALLKGSEDIKLTLLKGMEQRPIVEEGIADSMTQWLDDVSSQNLHRGILKLYEGQKGIWMGHGVPRIIEIAKRYLDDADGMVRASAVYAFQDQHSLEPDSRSAIFALLEDPLSTVSVAAVEILLHHQALDLDTFLAAFKKDALGQPSWTWGLDIFSLVRFRFDSIDLDQVVLWMKQDIFYVQSAIVFLLQHQPGLDLEAIRSWLTNDYWAMRWAAFKILQYNDVLDRDIIVGMLGDDDQKIRREAVEAVQHQRHIDPGILSVTVQLLGDVCSGVRKLAIEALQCHQALELGTISAMAIEDDDHYVRSTAIKVLRHQPSLDLSTIKLWLKETDWFVLIEAIDALQYQCAMDAEIMRFLVAMTGNEHTLIQKAAIDILGHQKALDPEAISAVFEQLKNEDKYISEAAVKTLQNQPLLRIDRIKELLQDECRLQGNAIKLLQHRRDLELDPDTINTIFVHLGGSSDNSDCRQAAAEILQYHHDLQLDTVIPSIPSLYQEVLKSSFSEHTYWHFSNGNLHMVFGSRVIIFKTNQFQMEAVLKEAMAALEVPLPSYLRTAVLNDI